jgi:iron complex outermembrane receptor protein
MEVGGNLNDLSLEGLFNIKVTLASKEEETVRDSPSTVTVYTQADIRAIGARTLNDLLAVTPGFDVRPENQIDVRGISSTFNNRVLLLLDGVPMDDAYYGANGKTTDLVYLDYVERVEIIRGPGSALYGTNAFAGVVSVTTHTGALAKGGPALELIGGASTDREGRGTATYGNTFRSLKLATYLDYRKAAGPTYSLAPKDLGRSGDVSESRNDLSTGLKLSYLGSAQFSINYLRRTRDGLIATDNTLMPDSGYTTDWLGASLELQHHTGHFEVKARLSAAWDRWSNVDLMIIVPRVNPLAPDGLYEHPALEMWRGGLDIYGRYALGAHSLMLGALLEEVAVPDLTAGAPTDGRNGPPVGISERLMLSKTRRIAGAYLQYRWDIVKNLKLTAGGRLDNYSDFGTTINPRLALVSTPSRKIYGKAIFGSAFRAPAFRECCTNPNQYMIGNPALQPEKLVSAEGILGARPVPAVDLQVGAFANRVSQIIRSAPLVSGSRLLFENIPGFNTIGAEGEVTAQLRKVVTVRGNYTYVYGWNSSSPGTQADVPFITHHLANLLVTGNFLKHVQVTPFLQYRGGRSRDVALGDPRPALDPYFLLNANLRIYDVLVDKLELAILAKNLLNQKYYGPSTYPGRNPTVAPEDIPAPGFEIYAFVRYGFL